MRWVPTWKSTPNDDRSGSKAASNIFTSMKNEIARDVNFVHAREGIFSPGILFAKRTLWPLDYAANTKGANEDLAVLVDSRVQEEGHRLQLKPQKETLFEQ